MINEIKLRNKKTKQEIEVNDNSVYVLDSIDWGMPEISFNNYNVPFQIGSFYTGTVVREREIIIQIYIIADVSLTSMIGVSWEDYFKKQLEQIEQKKAVVNKMFSIYQEVELFVGEYAISGIPRSPVRYSKRVAENNQVMCLFELDLMCYDPMFYRYKRKVELSSMVNMFHFPLIMPIESGVVFGEVFPRVAALVENDGDIPVGCIITMTAHGGTVNDPKIINVNTNEYIGFEGVSLADGEYIVIDTRKGKEKAVKHTSSRDISLIGNLIEGSEFLQISIGSEYYFYDMNGSEQNLATVIEYSENVFNFEGM